MAFESERKRGIFIFSVARATSTTLFKICSQIVEQHEDRSSVRSDPTEVTTSRLLLEPFGQPYYLENGFSDCPGMTVQDNIPKSFEDALERVLNNYDKFVVAKDLGYQCAKLLLPEYDEQFSRLLEKYNILFLLRAPEETMASMYHVYYEDGNGDGYRSEEAGFVQLQSLFNAIEAKTGETPYVVHAEDYLRDPHGTLENCFKTFGVEYDPQYLTWEPLAQDDPGTADFRLWGDMWYSVFRSSGLRISDNKSNKKSHSGSDSGGGDGNNKVVRESKYPNTVHNNAHLARLYKEHKPAYEDMKARGRRA